jgi:hypothetical protein
MMQTNCARCFGQLGRRELLRESLLCADCDRQLLAMDVWREDLWLNPFDELELIGHCAKNSGDVDRGQS